MLSRKSIVILIIILLVIIGLAIVLMLTDKSFFLPKTSAPALNNNQRQNAGVLPSPEKGLKAQVPAVVLSPVEQLVTVQARNFAERFGSFSTDSRFNNLEEVQFLATPSFKKELAGQIKASVPAQEFYGVSSKALKVKINSLDEAGGKAEVVVSLQRDEAKTGQNNFVYYQDLKLSLIRFGETWLINSAEWQE